MKKKSLSLLLSGLLTVCLTGVGFASWLIIEGDTEDQIAGTVNVETIDSKKTEISYTWANNAGTEANITSASDGYADKEDEWDNLFSFGAPADATTGWLRNTGGIKECLSLTLNVSISNSDFLTGGTIELTVNSNNYTDNNGTPDDASDDITKKGYQWALDENYIEEFTLSKTTINAKEGTFSVTISTKWGEYFDKDNTAVGATGDTNADDNLNPYNYYNSTTPSRPSSTYATDANNTLTMLYTYLSSVTFNLTITAAV